LIMTGFVTDGNELNHEFLDQLLLIVDDEPLMRSGLRTVLQGSVPNILECGTGVEALTLIKNRDIALVLLDINLPDISGLEILEWIADNHKSTSVILISGDDSIDSAIKALHHGAVNFVRKPHDIDDIRLKVHNALQHLHLKRTNVMMTARLEQSERLHRFLVESSPDIIYTLDDHGCFTFINSRIETLLGFSRDELIGCPYFTIVHDDDLGRAIYAFNERRSDHRATTNVEIRLKCKQNGDFRFFEDRHVVTMLSAIGIYEQTATDSAADAQKKRYLGTYGVARDITERKRAEETITFQALHDHLTLLPNRQLFRDRLDLAIIHARRNNDVMAVMFIDLDRFKLVNDTYGHAEGDELLKNVASRLAKCMRAGDTLARQGGDEFTVLLPDLHNAENAAIIANKIKEDFERPYLVMGNDFRATASIGIAVFPRDGESADMLLRNADIAMYKAKINGKNGFKFFSPEINSSYQDRIMLENELRQAVSREEFELHFQPQVNIRSRRIVGMEALIRWRHPVHGLLNPGGFIELAEETGLMASITDWVLAEAFCQQAQWRAAGFLELRQAINISPLEFERHDFVERLFSHLSRHGIPGEFVELEITENLLLSDTPGVVDKMRLLRDRGVRISIDDFGTRYSSLNYLRSFPVSAIKIDQSFVSDMAQKQSTLPIINAIVGIARGFGLHLVAEGIETRAQMEALGNLGCDEMQGYLFSRPVPAAEVKDLLLRMAMPHDGTVPPEQFLAEMIPVDLEGVR
jgi:diguanylate cyclase (GGDEF)-like protein/PAS domain S-box-containing protein